MGELGREVAKGKEEDFRLFGNLEDSAMGGEAVSLLHSLFSLLFVHGLAINVSMDS